MRMGGIFQGFGAADLSGQPLSLRTVSSTGAATPNPLATAMQTVLQNWGHSKLPVDGKWGDCSQKAYISAVGEPPTPNTLVNGLQLYKFGVDPSQVKVWNKTSGLMCSDGSDQTTGANDESANPAMVVAKVFGIPLPADACPPGLVPDPNTLTCGCPINTYLDDTTGSCVALEQPPSAPPKTSTSLIGKLQVVPSLAKVVAFKPAISSKLAFQLKTPPPLAQKMGDSGVSWDRMSTLTLQPQGAGSKFSFLPANLRSMFSIGAPASADAAADKGAAAGGMSTPVKIFLGLGVVGALGGVGYWLYKRSQAQTAVANWYRANCYRSNCYSDNCGENPYDY